MSLPGIGPVVWETQFRKGQFVKLDGKTEVTIESVNPIGGDCAKYTVKHADGRIDVDVLERRLS